MSEGFSHRPVLERQRAGAGPGESTRTVSFTCVAAGLRYLGKTVGEALFPRRCAACRRFWTEGTPGQGQAVDERLTAIFHQEARRFLCPVCRDGFEPAAAPLCTCCGVMFKSRVGTNHLCGDCLKKPPAFRRARAVGVYSGGLMALIHHIKYRACLAMIEPLALLLREAFQQHWQPNEIDVVLPVPMHVGRLRERGFNQAQLLVAAWAAGEKAAASPIVQFAKGRSVLHRMRATTPQTGLGRQQRRRNMRGAFGVIAPGAVAGRRVLLVDDVYTTGATANEAARAVKRSGAETVDVLTVARTMPRFGL